MFEGLMSRWIILRECRWARAMKRSFITFFAGGFGIGFLRSISRSRGWKGKVRMK